MSFKNVCIPAAAKSLQSCPTLCDAIDGSSPIPGILQARTPEWVAISFSNAWTWEVKVKSLSHVWLLATPWTAACQARIFQARVLGWGAIAFSDVSLHIYIMLCRWQSYWNPSLSAMGTPVYKELLYLSMLVTFCNLAALATDNSAWSSRTLVLISVLQFIFLVT